jgi:hypothetical protein
MAEITTPIDSPWKTLIEQYFEEFMVFFFPEIHATIDWTRGYEFLDQEFQQIVRDAELGKRLADKLVKVWEQNGEEAIVYIHLEVQAQYDKDFDKRMFVYHYRIFDRFEQPIASLAILGDESDSWRPHCFGYEKGECQLSFKFPVVKLIDYKERWAELEQSRNIFAMVVRTHLKGLETRKTPEQRFHWKKELTNTLYEAKYSHKEILELFHFMDWMLRLPEELANKFDQFVKQKEAEKKVQYITHIERKGIDKGRAEGIEKGRVEMLLRLLEEKFGTLEPDIQATVSNLDEKSLFEWLKRSLTAQTLREVIGRR